MNPQLLKLSAKYVFKKLREQGPYFSPLVDDKIFVNRLFWNHLNLTKERIREEIEERLLLIPFLEEILIQGEKILLSVFLVHKKNNLPPA